MKQLLEKFNFELLHAFNFSSTGNKKVVLAGKMVRQFGQILHIWLIHLFFLMINFLYEMVKILHEKMLNEIYLY